MRPLVPRGRTDKLVGSKATRGIRPRRQRTVSATVTVPPALAAVRYYVLACADRKKAVAEAKEGNNCRASAATTLVTPPGPVSDIFPMTPDPIDVDYAVDPSRSTSANVFGTQGATLTATGADGTKYQLVIPANALDGQVGVSLTPVTQVTDLPMNDSLAAVEILPHGLTLRVPATLTITLPAGTPAPVAQQTGFLFHEGGEDFHLYPLENGAAIKLKLTHFSTPGVGLASDAQRTAIEAKPPTRTEEQYRNAISSELAAERARQLNGQPSDPQVLERVGAVLKEYFDDIVLPRLNAAKTDHTLADEAIREAFSWMRSAELLGLSDDARTSQAYATFGPILLHAADVHAAKCLASDLRSAAKLRQYARVAALLGLDAESQSIDEQARKCLRFEVTFTSSMTHDYTGPISGGTYTHEDSHLNFSVAADPVVLGAINHGSGVVRWTDFEYDELKSAPCQGGGSQTYTEEGTTTEDGTYDTSMLLDLNMYEQAAGDPAALRGYVRLNVLGVAESYEQRLHTCGGFNSGPFTNEHQRWLWSFVAAHDNSGSVTVPLESMTFLNKSTARRTFTGPVPDSQWSNLQENTVVTLRHVPQP